jgi:hypothetical protein
MNKKVKKFFCFFEKEKSLKIFLNIIQFYDF